MKSALVTGVTGQDGAYLAKFLLEKGYKVFGTYRRLSTPNFWRLHYLDVYDKVTFIPADIIDSRSISEALKKSDPDEIYHLAAQSFVGASFDQPLYTSDITGFGTVRLLEEVKKYNKDIRIYQASSSEMYGNINTKIKNENTAFHPSSPYAIAKLYSFWMINLYRKAYGMHATNGILFNHECVAEHTPVIIRNSRTGFISVKRIGELKSRKEKGTSIQQWPVSGMEIWDGQAFVPINFITATKRKAVDEFRCRTVNTRHGIVEATNHHNMFSEDGGKVKMEFLSVGQCLLHGEFPLEDNSNASSISHEEALFIGLMVGDGYISNEGRGRFSNKDQELLGLVSRLWKRIALGTTNIHEYETEYSSVMQLDLNGNSGYLRMLKNEIYTNDGLKRVPDRIINADTGAKLAFLEGYNLADGLKSSPTTYEFKNFKTSSAILAQGLLLLTSQVTGQDFNITFEESAESYGYYSINLLTDATTSVEKELKVVELLQSGMGQRAIYRDTGVSRTFIRKIQEGGHAGHSHLLKLRTEIKKALYHNAQPEWVYDIETGSGRFMAGVGKIIVSNSPIRGLEFVTRKVSNGVAKISLGLSNELKLGNLQAKRDWGYAPEYVEGMWMMLQQKNPDDYVLATSEAHSIKELVDEACKIAGIPTSKIKSTKENFRPYDVPDLRGDYSKAKKKLGWRPKTTFKKLVKIMVEEDISRWQRWLRREYFPWDAATSGYDSQVIFKKDK